MPSHVSQNRSKQTTGISDAQTITATESATLIQKKAFRSFDILLTPILYPLLRHSRDTDAVLHPQVDNRILAQIPTAASAAIKASADGSQASICVASRTIAEEYVLGNFGVKYKYAPQINPTTTQPTKLVLSIVSNNKSHGGDVI